MLMEDLPLDNAALKETIGDGKVEFCLHNPRSKSGMQTWEHGSLKCLTVTEHAK